MKQRVVVLTGAGISSQNDDGSKGIPTFRDSTDGLYNNIDLLSLVTTNGLKNHTRELFSACLDLKEKFSETLPNSAHKWLVELEDKYDVHIFTQNIDILHEQAGSTNVYHLHGDLETMVDMDTLENPEPIVDNVDGLIEMNKRPNVVLFGEMPFHVEHFAHMLVEKENTIIIIIGTSFDIGYLHDVLALGDFVKNTVYYIDPNHSEYIHDIFKLANINIINETAIEGVKNINL